MIHLATLLLAAAAHPQEMEMRLLDLRDGTTELTVTEGEVFVVRAAPQTGKVVRGATDPDGRLQPKSQGNGRFTFRALLRGTCKVVFPSGDGTITATITIRPENPAKEGEVAGLIKKLKDESPEERDGARRRLTEIGPDALTALEKADAGGDKEFAAGLAEVKASIPAAVLERYVRRAYQDQADFKGFKVVLADTKHAYLAKACPAARIFQWKLDLFSTTNPAYVRVVPGAADVVFVNDETATLARVAALLKRDGMAVNSAESAADVARFLASLRRDVAKAAFAGSATDSGWRVEGTLAVPSFEGPETATWTAVFDKEGALTETKTGSRRGK